jgi:hypothetical protein
MKELSAQQVAQNLLKNQSCDTCTYKSSNDACYYTEYINNKIIYPHVAFREEYRTCKDWKPSSGHILTQAEIEELLQ